MRDLLVRSMSQRSKLTMIGKKRMALQQHLETLEASELNQQVLNSVKQTSDVLKSMGLSQKLENVDELMLDMSESHDDMRSIQVGLGTSHSTDIEDEDLEKELEMLFADEDTVFAKPSTSNSMGAVVTPVPAAVEPAVAAQETVPATVPETGTLVADEAPPQVRERAPPELAERPAAT